MATKEQVEYVFNYFIKIKPDEFFNRMNKTQAGVGAVIRILNNSPEPVSAGQISEIMHVSTARTAVLLKKMSQKNLIIKLGDKDDRRKTIVCLSETGKQTAERLKDELFKQISKIIDIAGIEKIEQFMTLSEELKNIILNNLPAPPDLD